MRCDGSDLSRSHASLVEDAVVLLLSRSWAVGLGEGAPRQDLIIFTRGGSHSLDKAAEGGIGH